jgi:hypothetical protein
MTKILKEAEVAKMLGVKTGTLQNWRSRGQGPQYTLIGDLPRYTEAGIENYLRKRTVTPKPRAKRRKQ